MNTDPQASTFSQLTGFSVDTSAALYAFLFSIALETAAMFAMMVAYSSPKVAPLKVEIEKPELEITPAPRLVTNNVSSAGSIMDFAVEALDRHAGAELEFDDFYLAYWKHSEANGLRALEPSEAVEQTNKLCRECKIPIAPRGRKRFLVGVRLKNASGARRQRLGSMTPKFSA